MHSPGGRSGTSAATTSTAPAHCVRACVEWTVNFAEDAVCLRYFRYHKDCVVCRRSKFGDFFLVLLASISHSNVYGTLGTGTALLVRNIRCLNLWCTRRDCTTATAALFHDDKVHHSAAIGAETQQKCIGAGVLGHYTGAAELCWQAESCHADCFLHRLG